MKCNRVLKEHNILYLLYQQTPDSNELYQHEMVIQNKDGIKRTGSSTCTEPYNWKRVSGKSQCTAPVAPAKILL